MKALLLIFCLIGSAFVPLEVKAAEGFSNTEIAEMKNHRQLVMDQYRHWLKILDDKKTDKNKIIKELRSLQKRNQAKFIEISNEFDHPEVAQKVMNGQIENLIKKLLNDPKFSKEVFRAQLRAELMQINSLDNYLFTATRWILEGYQHELTHDSYGQPKSEITGTDVLSLIVSPIPFSVMLAIDVVSFIPAFLLSCYTGF
jgi:hypothetical protein